MQGWSEEDNQALSEVVSRRRRASRGSLRECQFCEVSLVGRREVNRWVWEGSGVGAAL